MEIRVSGGGSERRGSRLALLRHDPGSILLLCLCCCCRSRPSRRGWLSYRGFCHRRHGAAEALVSWPEAFGPSSKPVLCRSLVLLGRALHTAFLLHGRLRRRFELVPVSYTHLTLPTIYSV